LAPSAALDATYLRGVECAFAVRGDLEETMSPSDHPNAQLIQESFEAFQRGDTSWLDAHMADDIVWHVGGNSKWAGAYRGKQAVGEYQARQAEALGSAPDVDVHDILANDDHVVVIGTASATAQDGSSAEWKYVNVFHVRDGKVTEVWGMAENDAAVDPFLDALDG
jgi:hypothetical protein